MQFRSVLFTALLAGSTAMPATTLAETDTARPVKASEEINAAQQLVFLDGHLSGTHRGNVLSYGFVRRSGSDDGFSDTVRMFVTGEDGADRRDLRFDFLTGPRRIDFQPTRGYVGNPLIILFLERDIRDMSEATGGSAAHFRNQIRRSFENPQMEPVSIDFDGRQIEGVRVSVLPYREDPFLERFQDYADKRYDFVFSREIPGQLYQIHTDVPGLDGKPVEELTFQALN